MKNLSITFCLVLLSLAGFSQNCYWHENMEVIDSVFTSQTAGIDDWQGNTRIAHSGIQCDSSQVGTSSSRYLESDMLDFTGNIYVQLSFWHICRIDFFDGGTVEYSDDGGNNWLPIPATLYDPTLPDAPAFVGQGGVFTSATNLDWDPANPGTVATNAMWKLARFDISSIVGGLSQIKIRFKLSDLSNPGPSGYPGWFIDDICIEAAPCELIPPVITYINPLQGTVYNLGPFNVFADITDPSGLVTQDLTYTVNGGAPSSIPMTFVTGNTWTAQIPAVLEGDTVCYSITAVDNSGCNNSTTSNTLCFITSNGISFPYCDNFDVTTNLWVDSGSVSTGSAWEIGAPTTFPTSAHSPANCWEVALNQTYLDNTEAYLYSPIFNFQGAVNASIELWLNSQCEQGWDGTRIEFDTLGGASSAWNVLGNQGTGTNWYNDNIVNSSQLPGWTGSSQTIAGAAGWFKAKHSLSMLDNVPYVQFRFVFTADAIINGDGFAIDDICITVPSPQDAGVAQIYQPAGQAPAGLCIPVSVLIQNNGSQPITSTTVTYVQTSGAGMPQTGTVTWSGLLNPNDTTTVNIIPCFTVPAGPYCIQAYTSLTNDGNFFNDSTTICGIGIPVLTPTSCDDMESGNIGWLPNPSAATSWNIGAPAFGVTTGGHNSVNAWDVNLTGAYLANASDTLYSPFYDMSAPTVINPNLTFWQNRNTETTRDGLRIEYQLNNGAWQVLGTCNNDPNALNWYNQCDLNFSLIPAWDGNSNGWQRSTYFLSAIAPFPGTGTMRFRYIFKSNFGTQLDGVSIDDFCVNIPCANDVGVITANSYTQSLGGSAAEGTLDSVIVSLHNYGTSSQTAVNVQYQIVQNGTVIFGPTAPYAWTGNLTTNSPGWNSATFVLPQTFTVPSGSFQIVVFTSLAGDCDAGNDTLNINAVGVPIIALDYNTPYCDDFESGNVGWTVNFAPGGNPATIWELGLPSFAPTNTTHSGVFAWDINLASAYTTGANVLLTSPIFDFTNANDTRLDFWQNRSASNFNDGVTMEVSVNSGPWVHFGDLQVNLNLNPGTAFNWYNNTVASNPTANGGWTGVGAWQQSIWFNLNFNPQVITFNGQQRVQFRYRFTSNTFTTGAGFTLDDFCLTVPVPLTTNPTSVTDLPLTPHLNFPGQNICFQTNIKNDGTTPITSTAVQLVIDGNTVSPDTVNYSPALAPGSSQVHQFNTCWAGAPGIHTVCAITSYPNQSTDLKPINDTICFTILIFDSAQISTQPKCYDFETGPQWVTLNSINLLPTSSWTLGLPQKTTINTANSGTNAWVAGGLAGNYSNRDTSSLFSPLFVINGSLYYNIAFATAFKTEKNEDGGTLEYSSDYGVTWKQLGSQIDPNWMNTLDITALQIGAPGPQPHAGWSGNGSAWAQRNHDFCLGLPGTQNVIFRWRFNSDFSVEDEGWAIDDVCITPLAAFCSVGVDEVAEQFELLQNQPNPFGDVTTITFSIKEKGRTELQILDITGKLISTPLSAELSAGNYTVNLKAGDLASGIYFYALKHNDSRMVKKMIVAK